MALSFLFYIFNSHRPTQTYTDKSFPRATLPEEKLYALGATVQTILRRIFRQMNLIHLIRLIEHIFILIAKRLTVFVRPMSAEQKVSVSLCGSVAN